MPAPIHGDVQATFEVRMTQTLGTRLLIAPTSQDAKIQFHAAPGSGLSAADESTLAGHVRNFLRDGLTLLPVDVPPDFPFTLFKGLGSGSSAVVALPFQLSNAAAPGSGVQPLTQSFIGSSGFAVGVSKEYVSGLIDIDAIRRALDGYSVTLTVSGPFGISASVTYTLSFTSGPPPMFQSGGIEISGKVSASGNKWWSPNGWVSFTQLITLALDPSTQTVTPQRAGDPSVDQSLFIPHDTAVAIVRSQIDSALNNNTPSVRKVFTDARNALLKGLNTFDPVARLAYTGIEITHDGVIVRGEMGSRARRSAVVNIAETNNATAFTAFRELDSGRTYRPLHLVVGGAPAQQHLGRRREILHRRSSFHLSQTRGRHAAQSDLFAHRGDANPAGWTAKSALPAERPARCRTLCFAMDFPSCLDPSRCRSGGRASRIPSVLRNAIAAHVSIQASVPGREPLSRNVLVYFADWQPAKPLDALNAALARVRNSSALMVIVVLPTGAFDRSRRDIESKLPASGERRVLVQFTEDDESGWTNMFAVSKRPSVYLINARREFVWKHEGEPDPGELAAAIDKHHVETSQPRFRPLQLAISHGDAAPDALFETVGGDRFALHRFRGREVLLNFWQSWSAPCLTELGRLQRLHESGKGTPFIVAFHGSNSRNAIEEIRRRMGLSFALVQDSQQRIAQQFGVRCWPTTVLIGADGRTEHIQFGVNHEAPVNQSNARASVP